jgi:hypothetical protein
VMSVSLNSEYVVSGGRDNTCMLWSCKEIKSYEASRDPPEIKIPLLEIPEVIDA